MGQGLRTLAHAFFAGPVMNAFLNLKTAATMEPVTLAEVKAQLVIGTSLDDTLLTAEAVAARMEAESIMGAACVESTWEQVMDGFYSDGDFEQIYLLKHPVISIESIVYVDTAGVSQTLSSAKYQFIKTGTTGLGFVCPAYGEAWPGTRQQINAVTITFKAGWPLTTGDTPAPTTPATIKHWILQRTATMYAQREDVVQGSGSVLNVEMPRAYVNGLLDPYTVMRNV